MKKLFIGLLVLISACYSTPKKQPILNPEIVYKMDDYYWRLITTADGYVELQRLDSCGEWQREDTLKYEGGFASHVLASNPVFLNGKWRVYLKDGSYTSDDGVNYTKDTMKSNRIFHFWFHSINNSTPIDYYSSKDNVIWTTSKHNP